MAIDPERVKILLRAAVDCEDPPSRRTLLDAETGGDAAPCDPLDGLLAGYDQPPSDQDRPPGTDFEGTDASDVTRSFSSRPPGAATDDRATVDRPAGDGSSPVDTIIADRYKVREEIGEGGMGTVYLAEQLRPVRRCVALKLIKRGMDSRNVLARFESERQALALMEHPNIAHVLDAGTTADGCPFFVMELVKGVPITEFCDAHRLDLNGRLELLRQVCSAVQHAHQKGIIHRDLKPSNVLVESHDDRPVPKVIDFGLAKAISGMRLTEQSLFTAFGSVAGTPLYMAPEQASFNAVDIDTRADIYALGVILYELLTGSTPIARDSIRQSALDEMLRMIREVEPPAPSSRISTSEALPTLASNRQVEPARLSRLVQGDLDWIAMKALAKERERRYASAVGLADDLERYLKHVPVSAGPPTAAYRLRKFARRNRVQVAAAGLVLLALALGVVGTTLGLIEARRRRQQAERGLAQVTKMNDILGTIFKDLDPRSIRKDGEQLSVVLGKRLDRATEEIEGEATGDPLAVARMQMTLGNSQLSLGHPNRAILLFAKARTTFAAELGPDHPETLASMNNLASGYAAAGRNDLALKLFEETLALRKARLGPDHPETLASMSNLASSCLAVGRNDLAPELFREALASQKAKLGPDHPETLRSMNNLALSYAVAGQNDLALELREETLALQEAKLGRDHPETLASMGVLATSYAAAGRNDLALKLFEETLASQKAKLGRDHPETLRSMNNLAVSHLAVGRNDLALKLFEELLALQKAKLGPDHPETLMGMINLAESYADVGQDDLALKLFEESLALQKVKLGLDHPDTAACLEGQARCLANSGQLDRAGAILDQVIALFRKTQGEGHPGTFQARISRAEIDLARGRLDAAEEAGRVILEECRTGLGTDDRVTIAAGLALARMRQMRGDRDAAAALFRAALESARKNPTDREALATALADSGRSRLDAGDWSPAKAQLSEALAIREVEKPEHWGTAEVRSLLGGALMGEKKAAEAAPLLRSGYEGMARSAAAIPLVDRPGLVEALDRLIDAGEAAGTTAEIAVWKAKRAKLGAGGPKS
jgi:eukaryotic-like serine/threonine-protein kinase